MRAEGQPFWTAGRGAEPVHSRMAVVSVRSGRSSEQRGVGRSPFIPEWLLCRCAADGLPSSEAWGGARSFPNGCCVGAQRTVFRAARRGAEPVHSRMAVVSVRSGRSSEQRGVGRSPFIPEWLLCRCAADGLPSSGAWGGAPQIRMAVVSVRSGRSPEQRGVGRSPTDPKGGWASLPNLTAARCAARPATATQSPAPLHGDDRACWTLEAWQAGAKPRPHSLPLPTKCQRWTSRKRLAGSNSGPSVTPARLVG